MKEHKEQIGKVYTNAVSISKPILTDTDIKPGVDNQDNTENATPPDLDKETEEIIEIEKELGRHNED